MELCKETENFFDIINIVRTSNVDNLRCYWDYDNRFRIYLKGYPREAVFNFSNNSHFYINIFRSGEHSEAEWHVEVPNSSTKLEFNDLMYKVINLLSEVD